MDSGAPRHDSAVRVEEQGGVAEVILNRPPANVLNIETLTLLDHAVRQVAEEHRVRVVLIRGEGKHFSAGVDVGDHVGEKAAQMLQVFHGAVKAIWSCPVPTIAAVHGACMGGGLEIALAADLTCAAFEAKLGQPEIQVGVFPPVAAALLPAEVGFKNALDLVLTGRTVSGEEASRMRLVQRGWPQERLLDEARALATQLAALSRPVLIATKRAVRMADGRAFPEALKLAEQVYEVELMTTKDAHEGLQAFLEKRKPVWQHH